MVTIYKLVCPISGEIKYVGQTKNPSKRKIDHNTKPTKDKNPRLKSWKQSLRDKGLRPLFVVIETKETQKDADISEKFWILDSKKTNLNLAEGGINNLMSENHNSKKLKGKHLEDFYPAAEAKYIKYLISEATKGSKNPNFGGKHCTEVWKNKQILSQSKKPITVFDSNTGVYTEFINSKEAGKDLNCNPGQVRMAIQEGYRLKRRYLCFN